MQKISKVSVQQYGVRGLAISLPKVYASDNELDKGETIEIWREKYDGADVLIIKPQKVKFNTEKLTEAAA